MKRIKRYYRYIRYFLSWLFLEKTRGLDFTMRNKRIGIKAEGSNGYAATHITTLSYIFSKLDINENDGFIDIGCGKGAVLRYASNFPFKTIVGLEIEKFLCQIAWKNMKKLKLDEKIEIINEDALKL